MNTLPVRRHDAGFTLVELTVAITVLIIAICATASTVVTTSALNQSSHETAVARKAAESMIETLRNAPFQQVFALYNADPADDPGGANTAPGPRFAVAGLTVAPGAPGGVAGEILFPSAGPGLFENVDDPTLGMPRDLNADTMVNAMDRAADSPDP
jgi:type II secretory pathway pseudopilin PulG